MEIPQWFLQGGLNSDVFHQVQRMEVAKESEGYYENYLIWIKPFSLSLPTQPLPRVLTVIDGGSHVRALGEVHVEDLIVDVLRAGLLAGDHVRVPVITDSSAAEVYLIREAVYPFKRRAAVHHRQLLSWGEKIKIK